MPDPNAAGVTTKDGNRWLVPGWVASVKSTADRLAGELDQTRIQDPPPYYATIHQTVEKAICQARYHADRSRLIVCKGPFKRLRSLWRRIADWWTGGEVDQAWAQVHAAAQALLVIQARDVVKSQLADMAANVLTALDPDDVRRKSYLQTIQILAPPGRDICLADRVQLRAIRQACDSSGDGGHADARAFRNTLMLAGSLLAAVLTVVAVIAALDPGFRSAFAAAQTRPSAWYVFELELIASLSGLTGAVLSLQSYTGFQYTYGLPWVQAFLKGTTGAATGLLGVLLVRSGITGSLTLKAGASAFVAAVVFGYAQYLFTRLVDQKAKDVLKSAGSRSDPGITPSIPKGSDDLVLLTTSTAPWPQVSAVFPDMGPPAGGYPVVLTGSGFADATGVNFGGNAAAHFVINSDTQITATCPAGTGTVTITVTTPVGRSLADGAARFTYLPARPGASGARQP